MDDLISRAEAIDVLKRKQDDGKGDLSRFYNTIIQHDIEAIMQLPPIQPEIVNCKDCRKHNKKLGFDENYNITYKDDACPLIPWRGMSKGHEHDYQSCCFGERREVTE